MNFYQIATDILKECKISSIDSNIIGSNNEVNLQITQSINLSIINLSRACNWQELQKEHQFNCLSDENEYDLPDDFDRIIDETFYNKTKKIKLRGSFSATSWADLENNDDYDISYRIKNNKILLHPIPANNDLYKFEYISKNAVISNLGVRKEQFDDDRDRSLLDSYMLRLDSCWRFLKMQGKNYAEKQREADIVINERRSINSGNRIIYPKYHNNIDKRYFNNG